MNVYVVVRRDMSSASNLEEVVGVFTSERLGHIDIGVEVLEDGNDRYQYFLTEHNLVTEEKE